MWSKIENFKYTAFINNEDFPSIVHEITEGYIFNEMILFENNSSYYIMELDTDSMAKGGFSLDYTSSFSFQGFLFYYYFYYNGSDWFYSYNGVPKGQKFLYFNGAGTIQDGEYKLNTVSRKWEPQYLSGSDKPFPDLDFDGQYEIGANIYKSSILTGVYEWQGSAQKNDIKVGWHYYTHKATDENGNPTSDNVDVYESVQLEKKEGLWTYSYKDVDYFYDGDLPEGSFTMEGDGNSLVMSFVKLTDLDKDVWKFGGGAQIVV